MQGLKPSRRLHTGAQTLDLAALSSPPLPNRRADSPTVRAAGVSSIASWVFGGMLLFAFLGDLLKHVPGGGKFVNWLASLYLGFFKWLVGDPARPEPRTTTLLPHCGGVRSPPGGR